MAIRGSESQISNGGGGSDFATGIFSVGFGRPVPPNTLGIGTSSSSANGTHCQPGLPLLVGSRWPLVTGRTFWTKYCLLCTLCGTAATVLAGIFLIVAALLRYHTTSIYYFETVPTYVPAILLSICGVSTIAFSCKRNRNIILLRITACWSLVSAALSSVITITTSLIHMNRLQTLKECVYSRNPPSCTCFGHTYGIEGLGSGVEPLHFVFENTVDCDVIHGVLYSCLRAVFAISVVAVLLSIFLCMLLYQLIGHERKKAYWSRIRRINSDWSSDFLSCLTRPLPHDRSLLPLMASTPGSMGLGIRGSASLISMGMSHQGIQWGPPPPYELSSDIGVTGVEEPPRRRASFLCTAPVLQENDGNPSFVSNNRGGISILPFGRSTSFHNQESSDGSSRSSIQHQYTPTITTIVQQEGRPTSSLSQSETREFAPLPPPPPRLLLRESKISIESDSENLYSQDDEIFQEGSIIIYNHDSPPNKSELFPGSSSNDRFPGKCITPSPICIGHKPGNTSLPSSPLLTNIKKILRRRLSGNDENPCYQLVLDDETVSKATTGSSKLPEVMAVNTIKSSRSLPGSPLRILNLPSSLSRKELMESFEKDNELC